MKLYLKLFIHFLYWVVYAMLSLALSMLKSDSDWPSVGTLTPHYIINFVWAIVAFYLFYFYFIRFFEKKRFTLYLLYSLLMSIVVTFAFLPFHKLFFPGFKIFDYHIFAPPMAGTFIIIQCGSLVRGFENWFSHIQLKSELENQNLKNELELLKSQINPHFLFNTLNNIDSLIHSAPQNASASLISLSEMLRYMIYEAKSDIVPLQKEIDYLKNYIGLQQLRFRNPDYIKVTFPKNCNSIFIAPMLFISFIENAFKHSVDSGVYPVIEILIQCEKKSVFLMCSNNFKEVENASARNNGVGLNNVKRRLELLYPDKHKLIIFKENSIFKVEMNLSL